MVASALRRLPRATKGLEICCYRRTGHRGKHVASVVPEAGLALLHLHGDDCLEHEAMEVRRGTKYILRSDVVFA